MVLLLQRASMIFIEVKSYLHLNILLGLIYVYILFICIS